MLYRSETWTNYCKRRIEAFEMWCYRRMQKTSWTDRITNDEVLKKWILDRRSL